MDLKLSDAIVPAERLLLLHAAVRGEEVSPLEPSASLVHLHHLHRVSWSGPFQSDVLLLEVSSTPL